MEICMNKRDVKVYVAGAISAPNIIEALGNIRKGTRLSTEVLLSGYTPFSPFIDFQFFLSLKDGEKITLGDIYGYSMTWLKSSDCVILVPGWEKSVGTQNEIKQATELVLPIFNSIEELNKWYGDNYEER